MQVTQPADSDARMRATHTLDRDLFLDAGAGCGKTRVLVDRYIRILDQEPDTSPHQIIAVTFTKKAAAEMKERVRARCQEFAAEHTDERWQRVARELETAPIDTIHGLCSRLLHENAVAARVDPVFAVIEGADAQILLEETVRRTLLDRLDADTDTTAQLVAALGMGASCEALCAIIRDRSRLTPLLAPHQTLPSPDDIQSNWEADLPDLLELMLTLLSQRRPWQSARAALEACAGAEPGEKLEQLRLHKLSLIERAQDARATVPERLEALSGLQEGSVRKGKAQNWQSEEAMLAVAEALRTFSTKSGSNYKAIAQLLDACGDQRLPDVALLTNAAAHEALAALQAYEDAKQSMSCLDFEDLQLKVRELWRDQRGQAVLQQYRRWLRHVLVDEFQDTNDLQKDVLWPLCEAGARLFVVGDAKQSIYRFRYADVTVFNRTRQAMAKAQASQVERLSVNFRSTPAITACINELFGRDEIMGSTPLSDFEARYEPVQSFREAPHEQALELYVVNAACDEDEPEADDESTGDLRGAEAILLAGRIAELVADGREVFDKQEELWRPVRYGDIGMLFRSTVDMPVYERALRMLEVPYYVVAGRGFYTRQEVRDVINCLRALENSLDEVALVGALRSPVFNLSDETLLWLRQLPGPWWDRLQAAGSGPHEGPLSHIRADEWPRVTFAARTLADLRAVKNRMPLSRLVTRIIECTGLSATLATRFGSDQMVSNLRKLADIAGELQQSGGYSLRGLIDRLQGMVVREEREGLAPVEEEDSNVVKLLTIHAAKGLEWPVVIAVDLARRDPPRRAPAFVSHPQLGVVVHGPRQEGDRLPALTTAINWLNEAEDAAEARRVFYVACTRARDLLILSSPLKNSRTADGKPLGWLASALSLDLETPGSTPISGNGWHGSATVVPSDELAPRARPRRRARPLVAITPPDQIARGALADLADHDTVSRLVRMTSPVDEDHGSGDRFHATALAAYLDCPRRYELIHVHGVPEEMPAPPRPDPAADLTPIELGDLVHEVLRIVGTGGPERLDRALSHGSGVDVRIPRRVHAHLSTVGQMVEWFLGTDLYVDRVSQAARLRTEMTVLFAAEDVLLEGKIDALVEDSDGGRHLIDYKTGRRDPRSSSEHEFQLGLYCAGVQAVGGGRLASASVVYLDQTAPCVVALDMDRAPGEAVEQALEAVAAIRAGRFQPRDDQRCSYCRLQWTCRGHQ